MPWANGLGISADVFLWPPDTADWTWRLSLAVVPGDVPFSVMPGIDRHIVVAQGVGMALTVDGGAEHRMDRSSPPFSFDGESATTCRLLDGPVADLNLMVRRDSAVGSIRTIRLRAGLEVAPAGDDVALIVLEGIVVGFDAQLNVFDAVLFDSSSTLANIATDSDATVAMISISVD